MICPVADTEDSSNDLSLPSIVHAILDSFTEQGYGIEWGHRPSDEHILRKTGRLAPTGAARYDPGET